MRWLVCALIAAVLSSVPLAAAKPEASGYRGPFVLRAWDDVQYVGAFRVRRDPTYRGAIRVFGAASACRLVSGPAHVRARWAPLGLRINLVTFGGVPAGETGCSRPDLIHIDRITVASRRWRTSRGLRVGDGAGRLRTLYPRASYRPVGEPFFPGSYWLVQSRERCFIGECPTPFVDVPRLVARMEGGRVAAFVVPVGAQGD